MDYDEKLIRTKNRYAIHKLISTKNGFAIHVNSLTAKSVLAGTKNSHLEGFLLAKHKHTNIPTMTEPFPPPAPWF